MIHAIFMRTVYCRVTETTIFGPAQPGLMTIIVWAFFVWLEFEIKKIKTLYFFSFLIYLGTCCTHPNPSATVCISCFLLYWNSKNGNEARPEPATCLRHGGHEFRLIPIFGTVCSCNLWQIIPWLNLKNQNSRRRRGTRKYSAQPWKYLPNHLDCTVAQPPPPAPPSQHIPHTHVQSPDYIQIQWFGLHFTWKQFRENPLEKSE